MVVKILQWNPKSIYNKKHVLDHFINTYDIKIFCLVESWLNDKKKFNLTNFNIISRNRETDTTGGGVTICIHKDFKFECLNDKFPIFINKCKQNSVEIIIAKIFLNKNSFINLVLIYSPPRGSKYKHTENGFWDSLLDFCTALENPVLCGDFNAINKMWDNFGTENKEGTELARSYENCDLVCLNNGNYTWTSKDLNSRSTLDLTFVDTNLTNGCMWDILDSTYGSDHYPILFSFNNSLDNYKNVRPKLDTRLLDIISFKNSCKNLINDPLNSEQQYDNLINNIKKFAIESGAKLINNCKIFKKVNSYWWNKECQDLMDKNKSNYREYKENPTIFNQAKYYTEKLENDKKIKNIRKDSFQNKFCGSINPSMNLSTVYKIANNFKNKFSNSNIVRESNIINDTVIQTAYNKLASSIDPPNNNYERMKYDSQPRTTKNSSILCENITFQEYRNALYSFKMDTAPGPDLINFKIIQSLPIELHHKIIEYFNFVLQSNEIPKSWTEYFVVFIPKPQSEKVRPISLANCFFKLYEKIIQRRLEWWAEENDIIPHTQAGFRKARSCIDSVAVFTTEVSKSFDKKEKTGALFLDIEGAYDNVDPLLLYKEFWKAGAPIPICNFILKMTERRTIQAYSDGNDLGKRVAIRGVPQGSVLSPLLFNFYL